MRHREFGGPEFITFLKALDKNLDSPFRLDLIGEAVAVLSFSVDSGTADLDTVTNIEPIIKAIAAAQEDSGLQIPLQSVGIYDAPYEYEKRSRRLRIPGLKKLQIFIPEKHDWALIKITRFLEKDAQDIQEVADSIGFSKTIFLKRFLSEMTHTTGRREDLVFNFLSMMAELFGEEEALKMQRVIEGHKNWR